MSPTPVILRTDIAGLEPYRGKVRDVYDLGDHLLVITTDRISAFDVVLPTGIPGKGQVLNELSAFWFDRIRSFCPNHYVTTDPDRINELLRSRGTEAPREMLEGRAMLGRKAAALPVECVVRGYLEGSGWKSYRESRNVCGIELSEGLQQGSRLPEPIFTPSTKAQVGHDENITHAEMARLIEPGQIDEVVRHSLDVYRFASDFARDHGIIIADTKFEFGVLDGQVVMIDECLTPDSSRFWHADRWKPGGPQPSFDKQFVRDYLDASGWNHEPPAPALPADVVEKTAAKYREIFERLTGAPLS